MSYTNFSEVKQTLTKEDSSEFPLISVVIPTYNHGNFLPDAIDSARQQTYPNIEIIVVDDGSTDNTNQVVASYEDELVFIRQKNQGLSSARNTGIKAAAGNYIALLDADDYWLPSFLSTVAAYLNSDPEIGAVHSGFFFVDERGDKLPQIGTETVPDNRMYDRLLDGEFFIPSSVLTRRSCFTRVGLFDEQLRASEDWDMWLRVARNYRFAGISEPLVNYRMHGKNMSADPEYMLRYQLLVLKKHFNSQDNSQSLRTKKDSKRAHAAVYRYAAQGFFYRGDRIRGQHYLRLALETNPDLVASPDLYYELGCVNQPLGWRGDLENLDFESNAVQLVSSLKAIFAEPDLPTELRERKKEAYAHASYVLGVLAYGSNRYRMTRAYFWKALTADISFVRRTEIWLTLVKTIFGQRSVQFIKNRIMAGQIVEEHHRAKI